MVRHIVTWNYKDGFTEAENKKNAEKAKADIEALKHSIGGIIEIEFTIDLLNSSNRDVVLDSLFESEEALSAYQVHPEHVKVKELMGRAFQDRVCMDYWFSNKNINPGS